MIKLIIFDMDGVLVDIKDIHYKTLNLALSDIDTKYEIPYAEHLSVYDGLKTSEKLNILSKTKQLPLDLHKQIWYAKQKKTIEYINQIKSDPNVRTTLERLKNDGFILAVASNSVRDTVKNVLVATDYIRYIDFFLSNDDVKNSKPNAEIYLKCMIKAGVSPKETIIIEDSPVGIRGANDTGANVLMVKNSKDITYGNIKNSIMGQDNKKITSSNKWINKKLNILIPMAGAGSRFQQAGYIFPKPLIEVNKEPMIKVVTDNLNIDANYIYIVQAEHYNRFHLKTLLNLITPDCKIIQTEGLTEGAACTALLSRDLVDNDNPLLIVNSDQYVDWDSFDFMYHIENSKLDGCILTFNSTHPKWSFAKLDTNGYVTEVAEKQPISNIATVGIYFWKKGSDFVKYADKMIHQNIRVNKEFYICPVYNEAIKDGKKFNTYNVKNMWGLGTPEDLNVFLEYNKEQ